MKISSYYDYIKYFCAFIATLIVLKCLHSNLLNHQEILDHGSYSDHSDLVYERNHLSFLLNREKQKIGQMQCDSGVISGTGGWCKNDSSPSSKEHLTDYKLAAYLSNFLKGKRMMEHPLLKT